MTGQNLFQEGIQIKFNETDSDYPEVLEFTDESKSVEEVKPTEEALPNKDEKPQEEINPELLIEVETEDNVVTDTTENTDFNLSPYVASLVDRGLLSSIDIEDFDKLTPTEQGEKLVEAFDIEQNNRINKFFDSLPEDLLNMIEHYQAGVPYKDIIDAHNTKVSYDKISDEDLKDSEELMKDILLKDKMLRGMSREEALEEIDYTSDLYKAAKLAKTRVIKYNNEKLENEKNRLAEQDKIQKQQQEKAVNDYKNLVYNTDEFIPGIKLSAQDRELVFKAGMREKGVKTIDDIYKADPYKTEAILNYLVNTTNGFTDWSKIDSKAKTANAKKLAAEIEASTKRRSTGGSVGDVSKTSSTDNVADRLLKQYGLK